MLIITFSGVDGCGKTTHVELLREHLAGGGMRVRVVVTLHVSATGVWARIQEGMQRFWRGRGHIGRYPRSEDLGHPSLKVRTYPKGRTFDADRRHWVVRLRRLVAYPVDCVALRLYLGWLRLAGCDAVICDRYTYDKMVALPEPACWLSRLMMRLAPGPACAFFLEVDPRIAAVRKPEHLADYYVTKHEAYREVVDWNVGLKAIPSVSIAETQRLIQSAVDAMGAQVSSQSVEDHCPVSR